MSESLEERAARQDAHWTTPRLLVLGLTFLACAISFIYAMASL